MLSCAYACASAGDFDARYSSRSRRYVQCIIESDQIGTQHTAHSSSHNATRPSLRFVRATKTKQTSEELLIAGGTHARAAVV